MRLFFGFDLPLDSKTRIAAWRDRFVRADGRSVPAANFHITLAFLGEIDHRGSRRYRSDILDDCRRDIVGCALSSQIAGVHPSLCRRG